MHDIAGRVVLHRVLASELGCRGAEGGEAVRGADGGHGASADYCII